MRKNPYEQGDELSRNDNWGLCEGLIDEVVVSVDKTVQYYYVLTFDNDRVLCKTLNPFAGPGYGAVYPFFKGDHVVIGFINNNPNCQAFILGGVHDRARAMPKEDDASLEDVRVFVPKDHKIVEKSNNKVTVVNKTTKDADDGNQVIAAERGILIIAGPNVPTDAKPEEGIQISAKDVDIISGNYRLIEDKDLDLRVGCNNKIILEGKANPGKLNMVPIANTQAGSNLFLNIKEYLVSLGVKIPPDFDDDIINYQNANCGVYVKVKA